MSDPRKPIKVPNRRLAAPVAKPRAKKAVGVAGPSRPSSYRGSLGMVVLDFANPFFGEVASAAEHAAEQSDLGMILAHSSGSTAKQEAMIEQLIERGVEGILVTPLDASASALKKLGSLPIPVVLVDCSSPIDSIGSVSVDNRQGGALAGQHLAACGHKRIAMLNGPASIQACGERLGGVFEGVKVAGLSAKAVHEVVVPATNEYEGQRALDRVLKTGATAVFCANDLLAIGLIRAATERGIDIPRDLSVLGYDDIGLAYALNPPLTTIRQPMRELGSLAARQLIAQVDGTRRPRSQELDPQLVIRESTSDVAN
ncbi:MAG: LacI family transcriptional regulator [Glaciecola sp.]|jgi:LacI family transcriptional regulator